MVDIHTHWQSKAQWYNLKISSTGKSYKVDFDTLGCTISKTGVIKLPADCNILNIESCVSTKKKSETGIDIVYLDDNIQGFTLPDKAALVDADIWVLIKRREAK